MIVLFTDFGTRDPYVGQVKARLLAHAPGQPVIDLLHEVPDYNAHAGAQLLAALYDKFPTGSVFLCVVDPGVGTPRDGVVVEAHGRWFVGPDNGLLSIVAARAGEVKFWRIKWQPVDAANTFHGRDIFAVIAGLIAAGEFPSDKLTVKNCLDVEFDSADLGRIIYIDHYGNAWTGIRAASLPKATRVVCRSHEFSQAETFAQVDKGEGFWFENSVGLLELAVNRSSAAGRFSLKVGDPVQLLKPN